ncbi:MAG: FtsQ-type POTRA domain-containing protein [Treponema sp.]|nr:FtsQ-type POTRA domain-containing protein [Treponema sp.]
MAGDYILNEDTVSASPRRLEKFLKAFIILAFLVLGGKMIWLMGVTPFRPLSRIDIVGYAGIPREQILAAAGITGMSSYFSTDVRVMETTLMASFPVIQSARVFRHFPDRLQIVLEARRPVAAALATVGGRTVPVFFDSQGVIFQIGKGEREPPLLPVVSGITIENPVLGMRLPVMFGSFFRQLERIGTASPELLTAISEIRITPKPFDGFNLTLYPVHRRTRVLINELNEETLRYTLLMVDVVASRESGIAMIDFRSSIASYIPKEASSE